jgi:hypothetical protein
MLRVAIVANTQQPPYGNNLKPPVRAFAALTQASLWVPAHYPGFVPTGGAAPAPLPAPLVEAMGRLRPQVVVCVGGGLFVPPAVRGLLPPETILVGIALSDPQGLPASLTVAPAFDLFYTQDPGSLSHYLERGVSARYLALAADARTFFPSPAVKRSDVLFVGKWTPYRHQLVEALAKVTSVRVLAYRGEGRWPLPPADQVDEEAPLRQEINAARLVLDPTRVELADAEDDTHRITPRAFMAAACGVPAVVERRCPLSGLFVPEEEILTFDGTPAGLVAAVHEVLGDEARLVRLGAAARRRVLAAHTWDHRVRQVLADVAKTCARDGGAAGDERRAGG